MINTGGLRTKGIFKRSLPGKPLISVITAVLNRKKYIEDTIKSVFGQTYDNIEYFIIDGGSTDGTLDIVKKYENKIDYWQSEPDNGLYDAMNKGIKLARGEWVHLLNSDDYYFNNEVLEKIVRYLDNSDKYFYYFTMIYELSDGKRKIYKHPIRWWNKFKLYYSAYIPHMTLFVMKKQYEEVGLYNLDFKIAADHDMVLRLCKKYKPVFVDTPLTVMREGGVSNKNFIRTFEDFKKVTIKNGLNPFLAELISKFKIWKYKKFSRSYFISEK